TYTYFKTVLPEPEDWSSNRILTFDAYMEEAPMVLPSGGLVLKNPGGESYRVTMILGWQLFQWENRQMTFPLQGNVMSGVSGGVTNWEIDPFPPSILTNVSEVVVGLESYTDPVIETNHIHMDNVRLGATRLWDSFEGPDYGWGGSESAVRVGVTANRSFGGSAGSLCLRWASPTGRVLAVTGDAGWQQDWSAYSAVRVQAWPEQADTDLRLVINGSVTTAVATAVAPACWSALTWELPAGVGTVTSLEIEVVTPAAVGKVYLDDLSVGTCPGRIEDVRAWTLKGGNRLTWSLSNTTGVQLVRLVCRTNTPLVTPTGGLVVADLPLSGGALFDVTHTNGVVDGSTYYYGVFVLYTNGAWSARTAESVAEVCRDLVAVDGGTCEAAFSRRNGALLYVYDKAAARNVSCGNEHASLWRAVFMGEDIPPIEASWFGPGDEVLDFSCAENPLVLSYAYADGTQSLHVAATVVPWEGRGVKLSLSITNNMAQPVRTVGAPQRVLFAVTNIRQVVFPIQEGMAFTRGFFEHGRRTCQPRPWLFADFVGLDSSDGVLSFYVRQDSSYGADLLRRHDTNRPVFQPSNIGVGASPATPGMACLDYEMATCIPPGERWDSPSLLLESGGASLRDAVAHYREANGFDDAALYPTLRDKLDTFNLFDRVARSMFLAIECHKAVDWTKAPYGDLWGTVEREWLDVLPRENILHFTHWQEGWLEHRHPDSLPIYETKFGPSNDLVHLLQTVREDDGWLAMPFCNWSVWNKEEDLVYSNGVLVPRPEACAKVRGPDAPFYEYFGYMTKPWHDNAYAVHSNMMMFYRNELPMDLMFVDMTCERTWRYTRVDTDTNGVDDAIFTGFTQATIDHNRDLRPFFPLYTEGVFDQMMGEVSGYCQTHRQKMMMDILAHVGEEFDDWVVFPLAADVAHRNVGFYQHDLNLQVFPITKKLLTHYTLMGYSYIVDVPTWYEENDAAGENWMYICDAYQKAVASRYFGQPLNAYDGAVGGDARIVRTSYGAGTNEITITANFRDGEACIAGAHTLAAEGFLATLPGDRLTAGIFTNAFNGAPLTPGDHFIIVERPTGSLVSVRQVQGAGTPIRITRPASWTGGVLAFYVLGDGSVEPAQDRITVTASDITLDYTNAAPGGAEVTGYTLADAMASGLPPFFLSVPRVETEAPDRV
ncbi:MAG: hypothetical protein JXB04_03135, partial [Kiritimatiellae bacterium]|nr:hypothetical protein [Kiritimatiellia bacterium]